MLEVGKTWSLGGVYLAVTYDSLDYHEHRYVKHAVLNTLYTDIQWFGSGEIFRDVRGVIFSGYNLLKDLTGSGYYTLISDQGTEGDYFLSNISPERLQALNYDTPVYRVTMKLRKELP